VVPLNNKFFGAVACLKTSVVELSYLLDQSSQARCFLWLSPLLGNKWQEQMFVHPLRINVDINQEPPLGRTSLGALEGAIVILILTVAMQR
jgi:hypothetical protein